MGDAGATPIPPEQDALLREKWEKSDIWPVTKEQASSIQRFDGVTKLFSRFCPEVANNSFGFFASDLARYADELDRELAQKRLAELGVGSEGAMI